MYAYAAKVLACQAGYAAVDETGNVSAFDADDLAWVIETATRKGPHRLVRVSPDVTAAWTSGRWDSPIEIHAELICFAGGEIGAEVLIGRSDAISQSLNLIPTTGRAS